MSTRTLAVLVGLLQLLALDFRHADTLDSRNNGPAYA